MLVRNGTGGLLLFQAGRGSEPRPQVWLPSKVFR